MVRIMVCGKGGSGKSAISVLIARTLSANYNVYLVDSDESNTLLSSMLGVEQPRPLIEYLGGRSEVFKKGEVNIVRALSKAGKGIVLNELPQEYVTTSSEGVKLLIIGKIRNFGEGCACPLNYLTRTLLKNLILREDEIVIVDTDAGIEHVGRGVEEGADMIIIVADPTAESLVLAKILKKSLEKRNKRFWLILNKSLPDLTEFMQRRAEDLGLKIDCFIKFDDEIFRSCLKGGKLMAESALEDIKKLLMKMNFKVN
ncbi:TPA: ATP-binding protein [Candidatus Bathyarchaeota archaeon]|nr:ATP-binding protein [Candidatus Bathyarchaeota archaeon]